MVTTKKAFLKLYIKGNEKEILKVHYKNQVTPKKAENKGLNRYKKYRK